MLPKPPKHLFDPLVENCLKDWEKKYPDDSQDQELRKEWIQTFETLGKEHVAKLTRGLHLLEEQIRSHGGHQ